MKDLEQYINEKRLCHLNNRPVNLDTATNDIGNALFGLYMFTQKIESFDDVMSSALETVIERLDKFNKTEAKEWADKLRSMLEVVKK